MLIYDIYIYNLKMLQGTRFNCRGTILFYKGKWWRSIYLYEQQKSLF